MSTPRAEWMKSLYGGGGTGASAGDAAPSTLPAVASATGRDGAGEGASTSMPSGGSGRREGERVPSGRREGERVPSGRMKDLSASSQGASSSSKERRDGRGGVAWVVASSGSKLQLGGQLPVGRRGGLRRSEEGESPRASGSWGLAHGTPPSTLLHPYLRNRHAALTERDDLAVMGTGSKAGGAGVMGRDAPAEASPGTPLNNSWKTDTGLQHGKSMTAEEEDEVRRTALAEITRMYKTNDGQQGEVTGGGGVFDNFVRGQKLFERRSRDKEAVLAAGKENPSTGGLSSSAAANALTPQRGREYVVGLVAQGTPGSGESREQGPSSTPRGALSASPSLGPADLSPIFLLESSSGGAASSSPLAIKGTKMHNAGDGQSSEDKAAERDNQLVRTLEFLGVAGTKLGAASGPTRGEAREGREATPLLASVASSRTGTPTTPQCGFVELDGDLLLTQTLADPDMDVGEEDGEGFIPLDAVMHSPASSISINDSDGDGEEGDAARGGEDTMSATALGRMGAEQRLRHESRSLVRDLQKGIGTDCSPLLERRLWRPREMFSDLVSGILSEVADNCRAGIKAPSPMPVRRRNPRGHSRGGSRQPRAGGGADSPGCTPASRRRPEKAKSRLNFVMLEGEDDGRSSVTPEMGASRPNLRSPPMFSPPISPMDGSSHGWASSPGYSPQMSAARTPRTPGGSYRPGSQSPLRLRARWCPAGLF